MKNDDLVLESVTRNKTQLQLLEKQLTRVAKESDDDSDAFYRQPYFIFPISTGAVLIVTLASVVIYLVIRKRKSEARKIAFELRNVGQRRRSLNE